MKNEHGYDDEARWLLSDGQILGKVRKAPHKGNIRLTLAMPYGEDLVVDVEKFNAASASQFCEIARSQYNEWKASKAAKETRIDDLPPEPAPTAPSVQASQAPVAINPFDPEAISARLADINRRIADLCEERRGLEKEKFMLDKFMEIINASETIGQTVPSVPTEEKDGDS